MKKIIAIISMMFVSFTVFCSPRQKELYQPAGFLDCWFVSASIGAGAVVENATLSPYGTAEAYIGKWLVPTMGVRAGYRGVNLIGSDDAIRGHCPKLDFIWDATTTFCGYKTERLLSVKPYVGGGVILSRFRGVSNAELMANAGVLFGFRILKNLDVILDASVMGSRSESWNTAGKIVLFPSVSAGVSYAVGRRTHFVKQEPASFDDSAYKTQIKALQDSLSAQRASIAKALAQRDRDTVYICNSDTVRISERKLFSVVVPFDLDSDKLTERERFHLQFLLSQIPSDCQMRIEGNADVNTGNPSYNLKLSQKRINAVMKYLRSLGFTDTVVETANGDTANRFPKIEHNRNCIIYFSL